jgi:hypothetical protein
MSEENPKDYDQVKYKSAWTGNIAIILIVVVILGAAVAYTEYF